MHSSWKHWWKATSRTPCPTALYILVCSCSAMRSWLDTWQRSASCWTSWSLSSSTWWRVALLKVSFRVSCPNMLDYIDWTRLTTLQIVCVKKKKWRRWLTWYSVWITTPHPMWTAWDFLTRFFRSDCWSCRLIINFFGSTHGETEIQLLRFSFNVMTRNVKLYVHSNDPVSWIGPSGMDDIIPGSHFFLWLWLIFKSVFIKNSSLFFVSIKTGTWSLDCFQKNKMQLSIFALCF